jgi:hypothetical protein
LNSLQLEVFKAAILFMTIGIYTSACSFSLEGEGWDEGDITCDFILLSSTLSATAPALLYLPTSM